LGGGVWGVGVACGRGQKVESGGGVLWGGGGGAILVVDAEVC